MSLPTKRTEGDRRSSHDESDDATSIHKEARDSEEKDEPSKTHSSDGDGDVSNSPESSEKETGASDNLPRRPTSRGSPKTSGSPKSRGSPKTGGSPKSCGSPKTGGSPKHRGSPKTVKRKLRPSSSGPGSSSDDAKCQNTAKKLKLETRESAGPSSSFSGMSRQLQMNLEWVRSDSEKGESDATDNKASGSKLFESLDAKSDTDENSSDVSVNEGASIKSHENDNTSKFETTDIKTENKVCDTTGKVFTEMNVGKLLADAISNTFHKEGTTRLGISETTKLANDPKTLCAEMPPNVHRARAESISSNERMEIGSEHNTESEMEVGSEYGSATDAEKMDCTSEYRTGLQIVKSGSKSNSDHENMETKTESCASQEEMEYSNVKSTETEGMEYSSDSISCHENDSISNEVPIESNIENSSKLESESLIPLVLAKNESDDCTKPEREPSTPSTLENECVMSNENESTGDEVGSVDDSNSNKTIDGSIIVSDKLTSDGKQPVTKKAPLIIAEDPSNIDEEQSSKRKRSTDSDDGIEGKNVSKVSESTDIQKGTDASSVKFPDTDCDEFKENKDADCKRSSKK